MSIHKLSKQGAIILTGVIGLAGALCTYSINEIRFGGEMHRTNQQLHEFNADILPPPAYLIEPYLEASLVAREPGSVAQRAERLAALEQAFLARADHWAASDLEPGLRQGLATTVKEDGQAFWSLVNDRLLPAARRGDRAALDAAADELGRFYGSHREHIDALVAQASAHQQSLAEEAATTLALTTALLVLAGLMVAGGLAAALVLLRRRVIAPLTATAQVMERMAGGDLDAGERSEHGNDEMGTMTRAIEVFRAAARAERASAAAQREVVAALGTALERLAEGDFTHRIDGALAEEYEPLREGFNSSVERLSAMMRHVRITAQSVGTGAREIHSASDDLAARNEHQAASLEETAATMNHLTALVTDSAANAARVQAAMAETHREAAEGGVAVRRTVEAMAAIEASAQEIRQIIDVIDSIAFQTNLLALNAGVEAARAGDAGSGFAVVATEVRALAQRSAEAAQSIKTLINTSSAQVGEGVALVDETGTLLEAVLARIGAVNTQVSEIAEAAAAQATSLAQINLAVSDVDRVTQQNAAMVEEATAASRSLANEADELAALVAEFRLDAHGGESRRGTGAGLERGRPVGLWAPLREAA